MTSSSTKNKPDTLDGAKRLVFCILRPFFNKAGCDTYSSVQTRQISFRADEKVFFCADDAGIRAVEEGIRADEEGIRADEEGIRADEEGIRADEEDEEGIRADVEGICADELGIRADEEGILADTQGLENPLTCYSWYKADHNERPQPAALTAHQGFPGGLHATCDPNWSMCPLFGTHTTDSTRTDKLEDKVEEVQKSAARFVTGDYRSTTGITDTPRTLGQRLRIPSSKGWRRNSEPLPLPWEDMSERMDIIWILRSPADRQPRENCDKTDVFTWNMGLVIPEVFIRINMSASQPETQLVFDKSNISC
ncbi:hypothetical protein Bbelb_051060 [Branchiostoma belcheri]|nr:hypothetical protein Bbelb_051060 [Branchiostoma belcheri]